MNAHERLQNWRRIRVDKYMKLFGIIFSGIGKAILERQGNNIDYKINGIPLERVIKMNTLDVHQQLNLAIEEQRYEDAAILRDLIKKLTGPDVPVPAYLQLAGRGGRIQE